MGEVEGSGNIAFHDLGGFEMLILALVNICLREGEIHGNPRADHVNRRGVFPVGIELVSGIQRGEEAILQRLADASMHTN